MQDTARDRKAKKYSPSLVQLFSSYFKWRNSAILKISNIGLPLEFDWNIKKSKASIKCWEIENYPLKPLT